MTEPVEKHIVHCRNGGKVIIEGDRVEIHPSEPIVVMRGHWVKYLSPSEEAHRALENIGRSAAREMLEEAFTAVPMHVYEDDYDD